jgi:L-histidine Nalpha-methyltransferase
VTLADTTFEREPRSALAPAREAFRADVLSGLRAAPKRLSPKYFYDRTGSRLFDAICELPEYYLTRAELEILSGHANELTARLGTHVRVVEPGAGSGTKTRLLLDALGPARTVGYVPVDVAREHLAEAALRLRRELPWLSVDPVVADFTEHLPALPKERGTCDLLYFPGSTIGNFEPTEARRLLARFAVAASPGGAVVVGLDLKKDPRVLHAAYDDAQGITAAFNKNLLVRMNRELGADFRLDGFTHYAFFDPKEGRIEMHLVATERQTVHLGGTRITFEAGESIHTESSYKYDLGGAERLARSAGLALVDAWLDRARRFAVLLLRPTV